MSQIFVSMQNFTTCVNNAKNFLERGTVPRQTPPLMALGSQLTASPCQNHRPAMDMTWHATLRCHVMTCITSIICNWMNINKQWFIVGHCWTWKWSWMEQCHCSEHINFYKHMTKHVGVTSCWYLGGTVERHASTWWRCQRAFEQMRWQQRIAQSNHVQHSTISHHSSLDSLTSPVIPEPTHRSK